MKFNRSRPIGFFAALGIASYLLWAGQARQAAVKVSGSSPYDLQAVTLIFGVRDHVATKWDGSASISKGEIEKIGGYHFTPESKILGNNAWQCASHPWLPPPQDESGSRVAPYPNLVQPIGVTIYFRAPSDAELSIRTSQGTTSFSPADIVEPEGIPLLGHRVEAHRTPVVKPITDAEFEDDFPSLTSDGDTLWMAWQGFKDDGDLVFLRRYSQGGWGQRMTLSESPADVFRTAVAAVQGKALVVWSERQGKDWHLKARFHDGSASNKTEIITSGATQNLFHSVAGGRNGEFHVAYQSWRRRRSDIYFRSYAGNQWGPEIKLSDPSRGERENDWRPAVVSDHDGTVWVAWDSYAKGSYNILLRAVRDGKPGELIRVTDSRRFHANASLAVDSQNRIWVAWDEAGENWGKDHGFHVDEGTPLYKSRTVKVAVYAGGRWLTTLGQPGDLPTHSNYHHLRRYFHTPRLVADSAGRIWLFVRPRTSANYLSSLIAMGAKWEVFATYYNGDRWSDLFLIPNSVGRNGGELQVAADTQENVYVALVSNQRLWGGGLAGLPPQNNVILFARLGVRGPVVHELAARPPEPPTTLPSEPREREQISRLRNYTITVDGESYKIYRGDLHRHTEISGDGGGDGTLLDAYRYAMDAADLDFLAVTDHDSGSQARLHNPPPSRVPAGLSPVGEWRSPGRYPWWRIQKSCDLFHVPGFFTTIYGTERGVGYPNGHRNLFFPRRGVWILPRSAEESAGKENTGSRLYPYLRENGGLASSHTSNTIMGTDWRDYDPELEPLVEIYQGLRTSAEHEGAPLAMTGDHPDLWIGGYEPSGFVWNAWAKGYKLGVQASSDHLSTHRSYACLIAKDASREALFDAMRKRHSYAATSNILLDYRLRADGETYLQGDIVPAKSLPVLWIHVEGTATLSKISIIRDNEYVFSRELEEQTLEMEYKESSLTPGEHYYYVRVEQRDKNVAWSSPIWVEYAPR